MIINFTFLTSKIILLCLLVVIGYVLGKWRPLDAKTIASLLLYVISPIMIFQGMTLSTLSAGFFLLPLLFFTLASIVGWSTLQVAKRYWTDGTANLLAFTAGTANTGYFGFPIVLALFGDEGLAVAILSMAGFTLYEVTLGFYFTARGSHSLRESIRRVVRLPFLYAIIAGILLNQWAPPFIKETVLLLDPFKGAYTVLGMMMIGLSLSSVKLGDCDGWFIASCFALRFVLWPILLTGIIILDETYYGFFNPTHQGIIWLVGVVPLAANTVVVATELNVQPQKAALAVMLSTLFSIVYIPAFFSAVYT